MLYLWLKLFHIFFVISWFAGIFYLPRIYVNLAMVKKDSQEYELLLQMSNKLFKFMTPIAFLACVLGIILSINLELHFIYTNWLFLKIILVLFLIIYHTYCYILLLSFRKRNNKKSDKWYRVFNELPVILLLLILYLVFFKPF